MGCNYFKSNQNILRTRQRTKFYTDSDNALYIRLDPKLFFSKSLISRGYDDNNNDNAITQNNGAQSLW